MYKKKEFIWVIRFIMAAVVLVAGLFFVFSKKYFDTGYDLIRSFDSIKPIEYQQGDTLEQEMTFAVDKIRSVGICVVDRVYDSTGKLDISIVDKKNELIWQELIDIGSLQLQSITWFDVRQYVEPQQNYVLRISSDDMTGTLYIGSVESGNSSDAARENAIKNGEELYDPIVVETAFSTRLDKRMQIILLVWVFVAVLYLLGFERLFLNRKRTIITLSLTADILLISIYFRAGFVFRDSLNYPMFVGVVAAFLAVAGIYLFLLFKNIDKAELFFVVSTLIFGCVYSVVFPPYSMPDEEFHFAQAYRLSNMIMGQPINDADGYIYMRECDINYRELCPNNSYTIDMIKSLIRGDQDRSEKMLPSECQRVAAVPVTMYIPQAAGITLGRLLHVNYARLIFMSRLMSLFVFVFIVYWAIRLIPYGKWIFFAICQIPMLLETVSSCSYDTLILAFAFLFIAYLLKLCTQTGRVTRRQILVLAVVIFIFAPLKPVYAPFTALVFLLPDQSISEEKRKSRGCKIMLISVAAVSLLLIYKYSIGSMSQVRSDVISTNAEAVQNAGKTLSLDTTYQIANNKPYLWPSLEYAIENPLNLIESLMGSFIVYADEYWLAMTGCGLGHLWDWRNPTYIGIMILMLLYISYRKDNGQGNAIVSLRGRLWSILMVAASLFGVFLAMYLSYSKPEDKVIGGVQGRYMLPLLIVLPFFLKKNAHDNGRTSTEIIMLSLTVQILSILNIAMQIWNY